LAAELWHAHVPVIPRGPAHGGSTVAVVGDASRQGSWLRFCERLEEAQQPFFFADATTLPQDWQRDEVFAALLAPRVPPQTAAFLKKELRRQELAAMQEAKREKALKVRPHDVRALISARAAAGGA